MPVVQARRLFVREQGEQLEGADSGAGYLECAPELAFTCEWQDFSARAVGVAREHAHVRMSHRVVADLCKPTLNFVSVGKRSHLLNPHFNRKNAIAAQLWARCVEITFVDRKVRPTFGALRHALWSADFARSFERHGFHLKTPSSRFDLIGMLFGVLQRASPAHRHIVCAESIFREKSRPAILAFLATFEQQSLFRGFIRFAILDRGNGFFRRVARPAAVVVVALILRAVVVHEFRGALLIGRRHSASEALCSVSQSDVVFHLFSPARW